ncbi:hypothetical protein YTPLAS18_07660 [Nitrospira sp.]|nr:hypothetical protein YTPLAS18_07660 [Nitrospira sp.]
MWGMTWTVKVSKLCNLRCRYCYEWNDLDNPIRLTFSEWTKVLIAIAEQHNRQASRFGERGRSYIVWHGGEPLLLSPGYFEDVIRLQREILPAGCLWRGDIRNVLQTNLYKLQDEHLEMLERQRFEIVVSLDDVPGVRVTAAGVDSQGTVLANLARVLERQIPVTGAVVLASHTKGRLMDIYRQFRQWNVPFRVNPITPAPPSAPISGLMLSEAEMTDALGELFVYWLDSGAALWVEPLFSALQTVLLRMTGLERRPYRRRQDGDSRIIVDTDGTLYASLDRYVVGHAMGNIFTQPLVDIIEGSAYEASLQREEQRVQIRCASCHYQGPCNSIPLTQSSYEARQEGCGVYAGLCRFIESFLRDDGLDESELGHLMPIGAEGWSINPLVAL